MGFESFKANELYPCRRCGRKAKGRDGILTTWGGKFLPRAFLCRDCVEALSAEEQAEREEKKWRGIADELKGESPKVNEANAMRLLLNELTLAGNAQVSLAELTRAFNAKISRSYSSRVVSRLLRRMSFTERRRLTRRKLTYVVFVEKVS